MRERGIVIAVDGPSGAGKSTISRALSQQLGYLEIDTGAMYRAMAWLARETGLDFDDTEAVDQFSQQADVAQAILDLENKNIEMQRDISAKTIQVRNEENRYLARKKSNAGK